MADSDHPPGNGYSGTDSSTGCREDSRKNGSNGNGAPLPCRVGARPGGRPRSAGCSLRRGCASCVVRSWYGRQARRNARTTGRPGAQPTAPGTMTTTTREKAAPSRAGVRVAPWAWRRKRRRCYSSLRPIIRHPGTAGPGSHADQGPSQRILAPRRRLASWADRQPRREHRNQCSPAAACVSPERPLSASWRPRCPSPSETTILHRPSCTLCARPPAAHPPPV